MNSTAFWKDIIGVKDTSLLEEVSANSRTWKAQKREIIIREKEKLSEIPFLVSGVVKSYCLNADGKEKIFCFGYLPGEPVTAIYQLDTEITSVCTIEVVRDSTLLFVPLEILDRFVRSNLEAARIYEKMLSDSLKQTIERDHILASCPAYERYEWFLRTYPGLEKLISKKDTASFLNMSSESLSRILKIYGENGAADRPADGTENRSVDRTINKSKRK
ncbi:MAG: Crp/Fnr family transcriptional regulator [Clostridiales bacterium]|nr:Crp/Fnr family transcriptional regulator [Clostridiales bacterium]